MRVHGEVVDMYYGVPIEERLPPPPSTEIAPSVEPKHYQAPRQSLQFEEERHVAQGEPEKHDASTVLLLALEEPSLENAQVRQHGFFTDVPSGETTQAQPSTVVSQDLPPAALPSSETSEVALPASGASQPEAALPVVAQVVQPAEAARAPRTSQDPPFSAPSMEWDATR
jgi:hypothetical protein